MYLYKDLVPAKTDTTAIEAAIKTLSDNEALDDKALAALETLVKAIDLTPYAETTEVAQAIADIPPEVIHLDRAFVEADFIDDWKLCNQVLTDTVASTITVRLWLRVDKTSAIPIGGPRIEPIPAQGPTPVDNGDGSFTVTLKGNVPLTYFPSRTRPTDPGFTANSLTFTAGQLTRVEFDALDAAGNSLNNASMNIPAALTQAQDSFSVDFVDAVSVRVRLTYADASTDTYTYTIAA